MCACAYARACVCMSASDHPRTIAAARQLTATFLPGGRPGTSPWRTIPGWHLAGRWLKVTWKCKKVAKSFGGSGEMSIFAGDNEPFKQNDNEKVLQTHHLHWH